uniref:Pecanex-like protein n=1 Tax=Heterorhabditis bacteriophora TaxID=37862 RepID=A0A1I7WWL8_HETBA
MAVELLGITATEYNAVFTKTFFRISYLLLPCYLHLLNISIFLRCITCSDHGLSLSGKYVILFLFYSPIYLFSRDLMYDLARFLVILLLFVAGFTLHVTSIFQVGSVKCVSIS